MSCHALGRFSYRQMPPGARPAEGRRHVDDGSISAEDMAYHQKRTAEADIRELIWRCRDQYRFAHELIRPRAPVPERLFDRDVLDLSLLHLPWSVLCSSYRKALFDPQMSLFEDQRTRELGRWRVFVEKECYARFTRDPGSIRAILEIANLLPVRGPIRDLPVGDLFRDIIRDIQERSEHDDDDHD